MSLKLLMIPFSIIMVLTLLIGFVKPDIAVLQEKKSLYATKLEQAKNMDALLANIDALVTDLNGKNTVASFVRDYVPKKIDQGRVIDMLNFLASQSGVAVVIMNLDQTEKNDGASEDVALNTLPPVPAELDMTGTVIAPPATSHAVQPKTFSARVTVKGRYENVKDFFQRLAHMDRMHKTRYFYVETPETNNDSGKADETGILEGGFEADFDYFDARMNQNALYVPVFSRGVFDMTSFEKMSKWVIEDVPLLEKPVTGRPNPFQ